MLEVYIKWQGKVIIIPNRKPQIRTGTIRYIGTSTNWEGSRGQSIRMWHNYHATCQEPCCETAETIFTWTRKALKVQRNHHHHPIHHVISKLFGHHWLLSIIARNSRAFHSIPWCEFRWFFTTTLLEATKIGLVLLGWMQARAGTAWVAETARWGRNAWGSFF